MRRLAILPLTAVLLMTVMAPAGRPSPAITPAFEPVGLLVDMAGNGVIEPGEYFGLAPIWHNGSGADADVTGTLTNAEGPAGATYTIFAPNADYGHFANDTETSCWDQPQLACYLLRVDDSPTRPVEHWDMTVTETLSTGDVKTWTLHIGRTFGDVSPTSKYYKSIETLVHDHIAAGCNTRPWFCPGRATTREQMAVFLLRSKEGGSYTPPPVGTPTFADVPPSSPFAPWIEELVRRGVTAGCATNPRRYCPTSEVSRQHMAIFLLRTLLGGDHTPPPVGTPTFADVPASSPYAPWIEELFDRGVISGCKDSPPRYCPIDPVTRQQMALFLRRTFGLVVYGP